MTLLDDFFLHSNSVNNITEEDYHKAAILIDAIDGISRTNYQSVYVIDYFKKNFLYVSDNPLFLCGHTPEEVKEMGYMFYFKHVPEKELNMLTEINKAGFSFINKIPPEERPAYTISYNFHLNVDKKEVLINHKLTTIAMNKEGKVWLAICVVALSPHSTTGHIEIHKKGTTDCWRYSLESHAWRKNETITLNEKEKQILYLSAQGYTMNEIAEKLFVSIDTVKFYRKKLFEKLEVKNISEAISYSTNYKLL